MEVGGCGILPVIAPTKPAIDPIRSRDTPIELEPGRATDFSASHVHVRYMDHDGKITWSKGHLGKRPGSPT